MRKVRIVIFSILAVVVMLSLLGAIAERIAGVAKPQIGLLRIEGVIESSESYLKLLKELEEKPQVRAIVLRVDSPGGVVGACQEIYEKVKSVAKKKPVVVSMGSVAASGGLYVSLPATKVVANPGTITGSIGVIIQSYNLKELADKIGIKVITVKSGKFKDILNPFKEPDPESVKILQELIDDSYSQFVGAVSESRKIPIEKVKEFADGRIFTGRQAKELGLVDELGGLDRAIEIAKRLCRCPEAEVYEAKEDVGILDRLLGGQKALTEVLRGNVEKFNLMYLLN